jgi:anti-sigma regulatory factor (Ser/Thr protein kinase)
MTLSSPPWSEPPLSPCGIGLRHNAFVYQSLDEYVARAVAFLREGLEAGEAAVVGHTRPGLAAMREALGADAARVTFLNVEEAYTRPARTLAAYHQVYVDQFRKASYVRVASDVQVGPSPADWAEWMGYEAMMNRCFAHLPTWALCTYNANGLPDAVLDAVWRTHPDVLADKRWTASDHFEDPADVLRRATPEPELLVELRTVPVGRDVESFRERLAQELASENVSAAKALDMLVAATEIFANAVQHGRGVAEVRVGRAEGRFVCEITDRGDGFDDPTVGYLAPREGVGTGLWVARQLTWRIEFFRASHGFTVRAWL